MPSNNQATDRNLWLVSLAIAIFSQIGALIALIFAGIPVVSRVGVVSIFIGVFISWLLVYLLLMLFAKSRHESR